MNDRSFDKLLDAWMELGPAAAPDRVAAAARLEARGIRQTPPVLGRWLPQRRVEMHRMVPFGIAAVVVALSILGVAYLAGLNVAAPPPTSAPSASASASAAAVPSLPELGLPGTSPNEPAGEYGWTGGATGGMRGMHWVVTDGDASREVAAISFGSASNCLRADEFITTPVRVAGLDGAFVEPYEPPVGFGGLDGDETTRAYALAVGDRTLCVFVTWHATTTTAERQTTLDVLETIKAEPFGDMSVRITFTLPAGWDTG